MNCEELRDLYDPYVDGELAAPVVAMVEAHLQSCVSCRAVVDERHALKAAIQRTARRYATPPLFAARLRRQMKVSPTTRFSSLRYLGAGWNPVAIAASLLLAIATSVGVTTSYVAPDREEQVVGQVVASHVRSLMGAHLTDVTFSQEAGLRSLFAGNVEAVPATVDMAAAGYTLVGGRLDYVADHRCAALVYRHDKHVVNLEVWRRDSSDRDDVTESYAREGYNLVHVTAGDLDYWAVSDLSRGELGNFMRDYVIATDTVTKKI